MIYIIVTPFYIFPMRVEKPITHMTRGSSLLVRPNKFWGFLICFLKKKKGEKKIL